MSFALFASKIQSEVLAERDALARAYREYPDANLYFGMVDLAQSSNYRLSKGPEAGYIRGESFFTLVNSATRAYADVRIFKEIGDAVIMCCPELRPLLEASLLMSQSARQLAFVAGDQTYPFALRLGIEFGVAKKLGRRHEDYLGECIDRLARIMSVRSDRTNFLMGEQAYELNRNILAEYSKLCSPSGPLQLKLSGGKQLQEQIIYREIVHQPDPIPEFSDYFVPWKKRAS
jgi:class 3 adenylate cyclase